MKPTEPGSPKQFLGEKNEKRHKASKSSARRDEMVIYREPSVRELKSTI